jgi:hypothetical protein
MTAPAGNDNGGDDNGSAGSGGAGGNQGGNAGGDGDFAAITSQEQFDKAFNQRWAREQAKTAEQYKGFDEFKSKAEKFDQLQAEQQTDAERREAAEKAAVQRAAEAEARAEKAEKAALRQRICFEEHLDPKFASRLTGDTEDELRADAKDTFGDFITTTASFDHGPRQQSAPQSMNDLIFGAAKKR